jgi:ATP-binding cassette, subfamily B, multidrug efflux pump
VTQGNRQPSGRGYRAPAKRDKAPEGRGDKALKAFHEEDDVQKSYDVRLLRQLWPFVRPHARILWGSLGALLLLAGLSLTRPYLMGVGLDAATHGDSTAARDGLLKAGLMLLGVMLVEQTMVFGQMFAMQVVGARAMSDLRVHVFRFLHSRKLGFFDNQPVGRLVTRVTNDVDSVGEMFASGALNAVGDLVKLIGIVTMMLALNWKLALIAFVALPPVGLLVNWVRHRARVAFREIRVKTARLNAFLAEQVSGMAVVQAYSREDAAQREFDEINVAYRDANIRSIALDATLDAVVEMVSSICVATMIWYAGARAFGETVSFGTLVAFIAYIEQFFGPIRDLSSRYTLLQSSMTGAERIFMLLDNQDEDAPAQAAKPGGSPELAFELDHVAFEYKPGVPILRDITIKARAGERVALVGATGSGKSTIASLLLRLYEVKSGAVRVFGNDVSSLERGELRRHFSVVPQDVFLFPGTVVDNVALGDTSPDRGRVEQALERVGALDLFSAREGGLDARVDERGSNFSAGERQLLAFARAIYRDAPILVLDEATASVDSVTEARLQRALERLLEGRTSLVIAHRLSTVRAADRIVVMRKGEVVEQGTHAELMAMRGVYARLYELQLGRHEPGTSAVAELRIPLTRRKHPPAPRLLACPARLTLRSCTGTLPGG